VPESFGAAGVDIVEQSGHVLEGFIVMADLPHPLSYFVRLLQMELSKQKSSFSILQGPLRSPSSSFHTSRCGPPTEKSYRCRSMSSWSYYVGSGLSRILGLLFLVWTEVYSKPR
jgi:hypothetical protein